MIRHHLAPPAPRPIRRVQVEGFTVGEGIHPAGSMLPWHDHAGPTICFLLQGSFTELWKGGAITCFPSLLKITPAGEPHWDRFDRGDVRGVMIEVDPARVDRLRSFAPAIDERVSFQGGQVAAVARRAYDEFRRDDTAAPLALEGLLLELVAAASRSRRREAKFGAPPWLRDVRDILHDEVAARRSLAELAEAAGVHPVTLARAFRRAYGCTIGEYLRRLRIERAAGQLGETDLPLAEIALSAGFSDQSHFSNVFRRQTGMSPSQFRRMVQVSPRSA